MKIKWGSTRTVILTKKYAFKIPYIGIYRNFLKGLLANMKEADFDIMKDPRLAKIIFKLPGGVLNVMKRAEPYTDRESNEIEEFLKDGYNGCNGSLEYIVEKKLDSFGYIDGKLVVVDYG